MGRGLGGEKASLIRTWLSWRVTISDLLVDSKNLLSGAFIDL